MKIVRDKFVYESEFWGGDTMFEHCFIIPDPRGWSPGGTYTGDPRKWIPGGAR